MSKPVIGYLGVYDKPKNAGSTIAGKPRTSISLAYTESIAKNGGIPMIVPFTADFDLLLESLRICGGVVIPGGVDADPKLFGEEPHVKCGQVDPSLDAMQMKAMEYLFENNIPTLGICRGCQMMNIFTGGTIWQDLSEFPTPVILHSQTSEPDHPFHKVTIGEGSRLQKLLGVQSIYTNTFHHQAVKALGKGFTAAAHSADGVIEAVEHENGIWLGVQWHPEQMTSSVPEMNALFRDLVEKADK